MDPRALAALSLAALRRLAAKRRLPGRSRMTREALLAALSAPVAGTSEQIPVAAKKASRPAAKKASQPAAKKASQPAAKKASRPAAKKASRPAAKKASRPAAKKASRPAVQTAEALRSPIETPVVPARPPREVEVRTLGTPAPVREPAAGDVFIDRGAVLPDCYPGTRVRVMVRDPETLFVYWEVPPEAGGEAWEIASLDADDRTLQAFRVGHEGVSGYLNVTSTSVERVTLRPVHRGLAEEPWATVDLDPTLPEPATATGPAPWVEVPEAFPDRDTPARREDSVPHAQQDTRRTRRRIATPAPGTTPAPDRAGLPARPGEVLDATSSTLPVVRRRT